MVKRSRDAAEAADPEGMIALGGSDAPLVFDVVGERGSGARGDEKGLTLTYFAIKGLGEVPRLLLAEGGVSYTSLAVQGGEPQEIVGNWRSLSPNGLLPIVSGLGIPRSSPVCQSSSIIRFLARRFDMDGGEDEAGKCAADLLFETAKDLGAKASEVVAATEAEAAEAKKEAVPKGPWALTKRLETMIAPDVDQLHLYRDQETRVTYGHLQLLRELMKLESKGASLAILSSPLAAFKDHMVNRPRLKAYLASNLCFPDTFGEIGQEGCYAYATGPKKRKEFHI